MLFLLNNTEEYMNSWNEYWINPLRGMEINIDNRQKKYVFLLKTYCIKIQYETNNSYIYIFYYAYNWNISYIEIEYSVSYDSTQNETISNFRVSFAKS